MTNKNSKIKTTLAVLTIFLFSVLSANAATISLSLGSYSSEIYKQGTVNIPVTVTATNISGTVNVVLSPKSGLGCDTCTLTPSFSGGTNEQQTVTFTLTGTQAGTYNPPFVSISASSGSTSATSLSSGSAVTVVERPTWTKSFSADESTINIDEQVTLTLTITPSGGSFTGVSADLTLPDGVTLISGSDPRSIGTISGQSSYQWIVKGTSAGSKSISVGISATNPQESASSNTETETITVSEEAAEEDDNTGGGSSGGAAGGATTTALSTVSSTITELKVSTPTTITINNSATGLYEAVVGVTEALSNIKFTFSKIDSAPLGTTASKSDEKVFKYMEISMSSGKDKVEKATLKFKVEKSWLLNNTLDKNSVRLFRFTTTWDELKTTLSEEDATYVYYEAETPGFSYFKISASTTTAATGTTTPTGSEETTISTSTTPQEKITTPTNTPKTAKNNNGILLAVIIIAVFVIIGMIIGKKGKKSESEHNPQEPHVEKISEYAETQEKKGVSEEKVKENLEKAGWDKESIEKGVHHKHHKK